MRIITCASKIVLLTALFSVAVAGCGRKAPDQASGAPTSGSPATSSSGASGSGGTGSSAGTLIDDSVITTKVKTALLSDSEIKGSDISVETKQGEVMLSGFVRDKVQFDKAVKVASAVEGVKKVNNKMSVKQ
jgi:hyperosmotically inducible periplasmic protein